ncbi:MAG: glycosyltransferase family 2 protein [Candidatus Omnitrophota bacterium]
MRHDNLVSVVILNLNGEEHTSECIKSLADSDYRDFHVILVDNGSTDDSPQKLKQRFPSVSFIRNNSNLGFCRGVNIGIEYALENTTSKYILLLNNDTAVNKNFLYELVDVFMEHKDIGIVGGVEYRYDRPDKIRMAGHKFFWWIGLQGRVKKVRAPGPRDVQSVPGSCLMIRKKVIEKIGLLDERFFAYYDDADWCFRARNAGYRVAYSPKAGIRHRASQVIKKRTPEEYYFYARNQPLFMLKHCPRLFLANYFIVYFLKIFLRVIYFKLTAQKEKSSAVFKGFSDFLKGNYGKGWFND